MKILMRVILLSGIVGFVIFLYFYVGTHNMGVFNPKGEVALAEMNLIVVTTLLMLIVVIPVFIMLAVFSFRYRASNPKAKYAPDWSNNTTLEVIWWTIPTIIILILGVMTWKSSHTLDPYRPLVSDTPPITIQVVALDWKWLFIYPEQNIAMINFVQFPVGTPVNFEITADAPMNSFWIPQLAGQIYAMQGMKTKLHLVASEAGDYDGLSANYSGAGFSGMKFVARASTKEEFEKWVDEVKNSPLALSSLEYGRLAEKSKNNAATYYSSVDENLYGNIIMKYMSPTKEKMSDTHEMNM